MMVVPKEECPMMIPEWKEEEGQTGCSLGWLS